MDFRLRRRRNLRAHLRYYAKAFLIAAALVAAGVGPLYLGWWDAALPAALASAVAALILFAVVGNLPLEAFAYVTLYLDPGPGGPPWPPRAFGRTLYRESGRLDAMAREAGLAPLSDFESPDPLDTKQAPLWHEPRAALPTIDHLLAHADPALRPHLEYLRGALEGAGKFYFLVNTWAGGTNARAEALRHGDLSVIAPR